MLPLTVRRLVRHLSTMPSTTFLSTLRFSALLATCGCGRAADAVGPPSLPLPPPAGCGNTGAGVCYHVDTTGNDANAGTAAAPFRTLQHAADIVNQIGRASGRERGEISVVAVSLKKKDIALIVLV